MKVCSVYECFQIDTVINSFIFCRLIVFMLDKMSGTPFVCISLTIEVTCYSSRKLIINSNIIYKGIIYDELRMLNSTLALKWSCERIQKINKVTQVIRWYLIILDVWCTYLVFQLQLPIDWTKYLTSDFYICDLLVNLHLERDYDNSDDI